MDSSLVATREGAPSLVGWRAIALVRSRIPEICIALVGAGLRFSMLRTYDVRVGYDSPDHLKYIRWFQSHWELPKLLLSRETYHPPLYYTVAGALARVTHGDLFWYGLPSMIFSTLTLLLLWGGMERHLPGRRVARLFALALLAVIPASVHPAGMMTGEGLNGFLATVGLLLGAEIVKRQIGGRGVVVLSLLTGVVVGLQMLTKISGLVTLGAVCGGMGLDALIRRGATRERLRRLIPAVLVVTGFLSTCEWYFSRNFFLYGKAVLSGYDGVDKPAAAGVDRIPYLERRPAEFYVGWSNDVLRHPYYPSGVVPHSYFWPPLIGSTFVDYYNYSYVRGPERPTELIANGRPMRLESQKYARASVIGGVPIALSTAIAWLWAAAVCVRRRSTVLLGFLLAPLLALVGQLHFAVAYPVDHEGPIKGIYLQFASLPLYALFGVAMEKLTTRRSTLPLAALGLLGVLAVTAYTVYARCIAV